jgi:hypothetical protein
VTSEKAVDTSQRMDLLVPRVGTLEPTVSALQSGAGWLTNSPPVYDSWQDTGGLQNGWGKGTGFFKFVHILPRLVLWHAEGLTCSGATVADGTVILSSANGFTTGYRPPAAHTFPAYTDDLKVGTHSGPAEAAQLAVQTDGSVQVRGVGTSATTLSSWGIFPTLFY